MNEKVLLTGGAGFIGLHLANKLLEEGFSIHLVDNFSRAVRDADLERLLSHPEVSFSSLDCLDREAVATLPINFDYIFHLAAIIGVVHVMERPYHVLLDNMQMLGNLIELARRQKNLKRFLFPSTSEVYAGTLEYFNLPIPTPEETPLAVTELSRPRTSYMLSKIAGEVLCHASAIPYTIFRPHNVYGPRMGLAHVVPGQLSKAWYARDGDNVLVPSVNQTRCFCYIDDALEMLIRMMLESKCEGQTLNLGTQDPEVKIREVAQICHEVVGRKILIQEEYPPPGSPERRVPDMSKTTGLTGYTSRISLYNGIEKTFAWYREHIFEGSGITAN
ncbi:dTDP-glucose 4,6-dehydratase/UDP-glucuronate decarboxylase [Ectothiorhodospira magna]|uniref:dTDP-glucose 4,6-dehydratase/UDP-glucuronate decarboxylase n=1 Tax=Ectothiorhodospira magna TaxID=867345 RepID=A0A1H9A1F9_9GAMM|nr:NAD-dependent epimerase/dehydratase family protein [Ectothiorhodospira magna]SEP70499.1 dTDP-glucose 4,6-dehydratase/UDP-glucuronate decarboxylase [Ectothiorhodospira magna]